MGQITPLVYLIREDDNIINNEEINQMTMQDATVYGTPLTGEEYLDDNTIFLMVIHKLTIGGLE